MMFPAAMSGKEKREKMAIMETAISASLSHPNIVQVGAAAPAVHHRSTVHCCKEFDQLLRLLVAPSWQCF